jgi:hypothetical protein
MNNVLKQRWLNAALPFNGLTVKFESEELTPLPALRQVLLAIIPALQERWPNAKIFGNGLISVVAS